MAMHKFSQTSGLIFSETIRRAPGGPNAFLNKCHGRKPEKTVSKHGAASLEAVAMRSVLCNLEFIGLEALRWIPVPILKRIWEAIEKNSLDSTRTWQLFTLALPSDPPALLRKQRVPVPEPCMDAYLAIHTDTFAWLSILTIIDVPFSYDDFVKLGHVKNLACLHMASSRRSSTESVHDSVVRGWSRLAQSGSFPRLKMLFLRNQWGVTVRSLAYLGAFPALTGVCVSGCGMSADDVPAKAAWDHGWKRSREGFSARVRSHMDGPSGLGLGDGVGWCTMVEQYVLDPPQAGTLASTVDISPGHVTPILVLELGREVSKHTFSLGSADEILWFERDTRHSTMAVPPKIDEAEKSELQEGGSRKRRKMRSVKKQDLNDILGGL